MEINFQMETGTQVKDRLTAGYRANRNAAVLELFSMIVFATPVKTGRARGGWRITQSSAAPSETNRWDPDGLQTISEEAQNLKGLGAFQDAYINNGVPYIEYLEGGSSQQAPEGMVRVSVSAFNMMRAG